VSEKLLVIDGHSMAFRAFFALPAESFTAAGGQHTNAVYGFLSMLVKLLDTEKPDRIAVAFDASRESFRTEIYPEYKGTRDSSPPEFEGQVQLIEAVLDKMGVKTITVPDFEADDVLATLATEGKARGMDVLIASGDRDTFQLGQRQGHCSLSGAVDLRSELHDTRGC
jgi:DNA polymerase-1